MFRRDVTAAPSSTLTEHRAAVPGISRKSGGTVKDSLLKLQRDIGNRAVGTVLQRSAAGGEEIGRAHV